MTNPHIAAIAQTLLAARRNRLPANPALHVDQLQSNDEAYAVQELVRKELAPEQAAVGRYWKSGASSREASLLSSALLDSGVWASPAQARDWPFNMRLIEIEIALKTNRHVSPAEAATLTHEQAHALIGAMAVTIEVVDSRWQQTEQLQPLLKLADLQTHGALVVGNWMPYSAQETERDWARQRCTVKIGQAPSDLRVFVRPWRRWQQRAPRARSRRGGRQRHRRRRQGRGRGCRICQRLAPAALINCRRRR